MEGEGFADGLGGTLREAEEGFLSLGVGEVGGGHLFKELRGGSGGEGLWGIECVGVARGAVRWRSRRLTGGWRRDAEGVAAGADGDGAGGRHLCFHWYFVVEEIQIERNTFRQQMREEPQQRADVVLPSDTRGAREVRLAGEDLADHAGAGVAGADFDEGADAVGVGSADDFGEIEGRYRLADDRVGGGIAGNFVGVAQSAAVEAEIG